MDANRALKEQALAVTHVLQIGEFPADLQRVIDAEFECHSEGEVMQSLHLQNEVQAILTRSNYTVSSSLLKQLPKLKVISTSGVGYDGIPVHQAQESNVIVTHTPGVLDGAVSELAVGLLLALMRQIPVADKFVRGSEWCSALAHALQSLPWLAASGDVAKGH